MNIDDLKSAWKCQGKPDFAKHNPDELVAHLKAEQNRCNRMQLWSDVFVFVVLTGVLVFMIVLQSRMEIVWPLYVNVTLMLGAAIYHPWYTRQWKKKEKQFSDSLQDELKKRSAWWEHQMRSASWNAIVVGLGVYGVFWRCAQSHRKQKRKVDLELEALGCTVSEEKTPMTHRVARILLSICVLGLCGYLVLQLFTKAPRTGMPIQPAPGFGQLGAFGEQEVQQIEAWLAEFREAGDFPSLMVAIVGDGRVLYQGAVGYADVRSHREATPETLWHVASVTKVFTCTLAAKLHARSVIDLDRPAVDYLPEGVSISITPLRGAAITLRQLASHSSGLPRSQPGDVQSARGQCALEPKRLYEQLGKVELLFDPGSSEEYSNLGMGLLGHALERAAGIPFDRLLKEEALAPLGMTRSGISVVDEHRNLLATGYDREGPRKPRRHSYHYRLAPSGGLITSVAELSQFLIAQMPKTPDDNDLFTGPVLANLHTPVKLSDGAEGGHALGWSVRERDSIGRVLEKNGGRINTSAWIGFVPEAGVGVAVMANCGDAAVKEIGFWLLERSVPNADPDKFDRNSAYAKVAPFTGVRWESDADRPSVRIRGDWLKLTAVDSIPIDHLMQIARENFDDLARKRFTEDLVELLAATGHNPGWTVTLMLDRDDGKGPVPFEEEMTEKKREAARDFAAKAPTP